MPARYLPVRPDLTQLKHQAKDLLRAIHRGDPDALADMELYGESSPLPNRKGGQGVRSESPGVRNGVRLADAQFILARSNGAASWPRLVQSCQIIDAIWQDDLETVRDLVLKHPNLLHENAGIRNANWGPPMSYAANLGRDRIITMLYRHGARDLESAFDRATLQGKIGTARMIHEWRGKPRPNAAALGGAAYTLSVSGTELILELGARVVDEKGRPAAPVEVVLCSDSRRPEAKHRILEMYVEHGLVLPDTPVMALHRGRIDLLAAHLGRDPGLLRRTFRHAEIFPPEFGCATYVETQGTPLDGTTLLHLCADFDEIEIGRWLLEKGMDPDAPAAIDAEGFGGYTALFGAVVCWANFWRNLHGGRTGRQAGGATPFTELLLEHGASPAARASIRKVHEDGKVSEYRDVTPVEYGERYYNRILVSEPAMRLIRLSNPRPGRSAS